MNKPKEIKIPPFLPGLVYGLFVCIIFGFALRHPDMMAHVKKFAAGFGYGWKQILIGPHDWGKGFTSLGLHALRLFALVVFGISFAGIGSRIAKSFDISPADQKETAIYSFALGLALWCLVVLALGLMGAIYPRILFAGMAAFMAWGFKPGLKMLGTLLKPDPDGAKTDICRGILILTAALLLFFYVINLLMPVRSGDALMYHLALPKLWARDHTVRFYPNLMHSNLPLLIEQGFLSFLVMGDEFLAKGLNLLILAWMLWALIRFGNELGGGKGGVLASIVFLSSPMVFVYCTLAQTELSAAFFVLLAVWALYRLISGAGEQWAAWALIATALCLASKLASAMLAGFLLILFIIICLKRKPRMKYLTVGICFFALLTGPWLIKSLATTGNPVWPFGYSLFGGAHWSAANNAVHNYLHVASVNMGRTPLDFILLPWRWGFKINGEILDRIGIGALLFLPLFLFKARSGKRAVILCGLAFFGTYLLIWFLFSPQERYLVHLMGVWSLMVSMVIENPRDRIAKVAGRAAAAGMGIFLIAVNFFALAYTLPYAFPAQPLAQLRQDMFGNHAAMAEWINKNTPGNAGILLASSFMGYYLDRDYLWGVPDMQTQTGYERVENFRQLVEHWRKMGVTHIVVELGFLQSNDFLDRRRFSMYQRYFEMMDALRARPPGIELLDARIPGVEIYALEPGP